jgi:hypothetical protein
MNLTAACVTAKFFNRVGSAARSTQHTVFQLRSLPRAVSSVEILKRISSSSLPPSFASGRFAVFLFRRFDMHCTRSSASAA